MADHKGLPVAGYQPQSDDKINLVNENKALEERVLRQLDKMNKHNMDMEDAGIGKSGQHDPRFMALAKTAIQDGFMWMNRAVFQPGRVSLPEDTQTDQLQFNEVTNKLPKTRVRQNVPSLNVVVDTDYPIYKDGELWRYASGSPFSGKFLMPEELAVYKSAGYEL